MTMHRLLPLALSAVLSTGLCAQQAASTLTELARRATAIAIAQPLHVDSDDVTRTVTFAVRDWIAGTGPDTLVLSEPAERSCGRALTGLAVGAAYVVFLDRTEPSPRLLTSDARGIIVRSPGLIEHVRALRSASTAALPMLAAAALAAQDARVRADAALALSTLAGVERLPTSSHAALTAALADALAANETTVVPLSIAAARARADDALDLLVPAYLAGSQPRLERALHSAILRFEPHAVAERMAPHLALAGEAAVRLLAVVGELDAEVGDSLLLALARAGATETRPTAAARLLTRGVPATTLAQLGVDPQVTRIAADSAPRPIHFRSIDPRRIR